MHEVRCLLRHRQLLAARGRYDLLRGREARDRAFRAMRAKSSGGLGDAHEAATTLSSAELATLALGEGPYEFVKADLVDFDSLVRTYFSPTHFADLSPSPSPRPDPDQPSPAAPSEVGLQEHVLYEHAAEAYSGLAAALLLKADVYRVTPALRASRPAP